MQRCKDKLFTIDDVIRKRKHNLGYAGLTIKEGKKNAKRNARRNTMHKPLFSRRKFNNILFKELEGMKEIEVSPEFQGSSSRYLCVFIYFILQFFYCLVIPTEKKLSGISGIRLGRAYV